MSFGGVYVPIISSFDESGNIFLGGFQNVIDYLHSYGINGIWLLGSYGSFPLLSTEERKDIASFVIPYAKSKGMRLIANIGSTSTDAAIHLARHAQVNGADGIASTVPFYYSSGNYRIENFTIYFQTILNSVDIPVLFYNNTKATGFSPDISFFQLLLKMGVHGFKDKGDYLAMSNRIRLLKKSNPGGSYLAGSTSVQLQGHLLGATGVTSGVALVVPRLVKMLQDTLDTGDIKKAVLLQDIILQVRDVVGRYNSRAATCYDVLALKGVDAGTCRSPWSRIPDHAKDVLTEVKKLEKSF